MHTYASRVRCVDATHTMWSLLKDFQSNRIWGAPCCLKQIHIIVLLIPSRCRSKLCTPTIGCLMLC